jgi:radical SAM-linked protein
MLRALHKSKLPIWHTEGFNPHPFATFPLPLSLGFRGVNECMDVKLEDDDYSFEEIISKLNECLPRGIRVFDVTEAVMKAGKVAYASFTVKISNDKIASGKICAQINELLAQDKIEIEKKTKKKGYKTVDIKPGIKSFELSEKFDFALLDLVLSAGSTDNLNPNLLISALQNKTGAEYDVDITRNDLFDADMRPFR